MSLARRVSALVQFAVVVGVSCLVGAHAADAAQLTASWVDNSDGRAAFELQRRTQGTTTFATVADVPAGVTSYVDRSIVEGVTYCYRVRAYDAFGDSPYSVEACGASTVSTFSVTISKAGDGSGFVVSHPSAMYCGTRCTATYPSGTVVYLMTAADAGSTFLGWTGGGCSGIKMCAVTGNTAIRVTATFGVQKAAASTRNWLTSALPYHLLTAILDSGRDTLLGLTRTQ